MFATILAMKGYKVLVIDNDGQANASDFTGAELIPQPNVVRIENLYHEINVKTPDIKSKIDVALLIKAIQNTELGYDYIESSKLLRLWRTVIFNFRFSIFNSNAKTFRCRPYFRAGDGCYVSPGALSSQLPTLCDLRGALPRGARCRGGASHR